MNDKKIPKAKKGDVIDSSVYHQPLIQVEGRWIDLNKPITKEEIELLKKADLKIAMTVKVRTV